MKSILKISGTDILLSEASGCDREDYPSDTCGEVAEMRTYFSDPVHDELIKKYDILRRYFIYV